MSFTLFKIGFLPVTVIDVIDIAVMSYFIYRIYRMMRGTRGAQMLVGLIIILLFSSLAPIFQMKGVTWIFENLRNIWLVAFVILFQPEIRRLLILLGQSRFIRFFIKVSGSKVIDEVVQATTELRDRGYGALIVMVRETGVRPVIETGIRMQAEVSSPLILSIFNPRSPLHDGALIVQNDIIEAARCILPIPHESHGHTEYGTRHKAAINFSAETDAMVIVVSEERGIISIAIQGKFQYDLEPDELRQILTEGYRYGNTTIK
jgi:diadenylate cyclase